METPATVLSPFSDSCRPPNLPPSRVRNDFKLLGAELFCYTPNHGTSAMTVN
jgi:hypothetical protein